MSDYRVGLATVAYKIVHDLMIISCNQLSPIPCRNSIRAITFTDSKLETIFKRRV